MSDDNQHPPGIILLFAILCVIVAAPCFAATLTVPGTSDPWLAGMTNGATASSGDVAPPQSPAEVVGLSIVPGDQLLFAASGADCFIEWRGFGRLTVGFLAAMRGTSAG